MRALLIILVLAGTARADDLVQAKTRYDEGLRHYNLAEYPRAIEAWKEAYRLSKRPLLLFNIAQAYRLAGDCSNALTFYESYRREEAKPKPELDAAVEECKKQPEPDAKQEAPTPATAPAIEFGPIPKLVGRPPNRRLQIAGIVVGSASLLLGGAAGYFAYDSNQQSERLDNYDGPWGDDQASIERRGQRSALLAYVLGGAGVAGAIASGTLLWLGRDRRTIRVEVAPLRGGGASASIGVRF